MPYLIKAALAATLFCIAQSANALIVSAKMIGFEASPVTIDGIGTGGGRGTFEVTSTDVDQSSDLGEILQIGSTYQAICLEPDAYVSTGTSYHFEVVDLRDAPTMTPGIGEIRENFIEALIGRLGLTSVETLDLTQMHIMTALLYEAGYEAQTNPMDMFAGTTQLSGTGVAQAHLELLNASPIQYDVEAYGLRNIGEQANLSSFSVYEGQDFAIFTSSPVEAPGVMALFGLGLLGLSRFVKKVEKA